MNAALIVCGGFVFDPCFVIQYLMSVVMDAKYYKCLSSCVTISQGKGELVALLRLSSCLWAVSLPYGAVNGQQFVIVESLDILTKFYKQFCTKLINIFDRQGPG